MNYLELTLDELQALKGSASEEGSAAIAAAMLESDKDFPEFNEDDFSTVADRAANSPCDGMSFLDIYNASLGGLREEYNAAN